MNSPGGSVALALRGLTHVSLSVADIGRSLAFYRDVLGLPVLREPYDGEKFAGREAMVLTGRTAVCLQQHDANPGHRFDPTRTGLDHLAFAVPTRDELHAWVAKLAESAVENSGVKPLPGHGYFIELRDPDGILIELHCLGD